jgi:hypothetical protein
MAYEAMFATGASAGHCAAADATATGSSPCSCLPPLFLGYSASNLILSPYAQPTLARKKHTHATNAATSDTHQLAEQQSCGGEER